jgi:hypothetical protein
VPDRLTRARMFKGTLSRGTNERQFNISACWPCLILITDHNGVSFMSNSGGSAIDDHTPAAEDTTLPATSVNGASFAGRQLLIV